MHGQRILTAAILAPLTAFVILWGGSTTLASVVSVITAFCLYEFYTINFPSSKFTIFSGIAAGLIPVVTVALSQGARFLPFALYLVLLFSVIITLVTYKKHENPFIFMALFVFGAVYTGLCSSFIMLIRYLPMGKEWIFFLLTVIFLGDAGAYYTGKALGRHKLYPAVSGGKTIEGAMGGILFNIIGAVVIWFLLLDREASLLRLIPAVVLTGITGQAGDLAESVIKRACNVKDSSHILPGHGGFFDRVDALLLAAPFFYFLLSQEFFSCGP